MKERTVLGVPVVSLAELFSRLDIQENIVRNLLTGIEETNPGYKFSVNRDKNILNILVSLNDQGVDKETIRATMLVLKSRLLSNKIDHKDIQVITAQHPVDENQTVAESYYIQITLE